MSGDNYDKHVISRRIVVAHLGKIYSLDLDGLSEREEQRGDPKED
jgi:hypothetical protein